MADIVSKLAKVYTVSPNKSPRTHVIDTITIHHAAAVGCSAKTGADWFAFYSKGSSNYYIGYDGSISCPVPENYRAWTSNSSSNDDRAITIECANSTADPTWEISKDTWNSLINLLEDVCKRNGIKKLLWKADKSLIGQVDKQNMTIHNWFAPTGCPGPYLEPRIGEIAEEVNARLNPTSTPVTPTDQNEGEIYRIRKTWTDAASQIGAYKDYKLACEFTDKHPGYYVFSSKGKKLYPEVTSTPSKPVDKSFKVYIQTPVLNIRKGPGTNYARTGLFTGVGTFTIVETSTGIGSNSGWGKLKSGAGWVSLDYCKKI